MFLTDFYLTINETISFLCILLWYQKHIRFNFLPSFLDFKL